jgi:hypothetical protein
MPDAFVLRWLTQIATALHGLSPEPVFVGGVAVQVHLLGAQLDVRTTDDIDCAIEITTRTEYYSFSQQLRARGFLEDSAPDAPLCRWKYQGITLDMMPCDAGVLGYSNQWYPDGIRYAVTKILPEGIPIKVFSLPYLVASKIEAFEHRGTGDLYGSRDVEDILLITSYADEFPGELQKSERKLKVFISRWFEALLNRRGVADIIASSFSPYSDEGQVVRTLDVIRSIASLP